MDYYGDYYTGSVLTNKPPIRNVANTISAAKMKLYINAGLSSVKIAKKLGVSYVTILRAVDKRIPEFSAQLRANGKKHQIRRASDKAS